MIHGDGYPMPEWLIGHREINKRQPRDELLSTDYEFFSYY